MVVRKQTLLESAMGGERTPASSPEPDRRPLNQGLAAIWQTSAMAHRSITISDNKAIFVWVFMAVWMSGVATITLGVIKSGRPLDGLPAPVGALLILLLWAAGIVGTVLLFQVPVTRLTIVDGWVTAREFWLWKRRETRFSPCKDHLRIIRETWVEGDDSFRLELMAPEGRVLTVATSMQEAEVEAKRDLLIAALGEGAT